MRLLSFMYRWRLYVKTANSTSQATFGFVRHRNCRSPHFAFDPGVRKLRYSCALTIYLRCMVSAHPFIECSNGYLVFRDGDLAPGLFQFAIPAASLS